MYYVGIDTSCYTTSLAVLDQDGELRLDARRLLRVKDGERGLRQSDGLFQHIVNLEEMVGELAFLNGKIKSVTASTKPRNEEGSYMPVFRGGSLAGSFLVAGTNSPLYTSSHQEGHLYSALWSLRKEIKLEEMDRFFFFHISGGTTELLFAEKLDRIRFSLKRIGGTSDLNGGQFIDRVGVAAGLSFPCGKEMDRQLRESATGKIEKDEKIHLKTTVKDGEVSFSGPETQAVRLLSAGTKKEVVYLAVFEAIEKALYKIIKNGQEKYQVEHILISGGVAANSFLRKGLESRLRKEGLKVYFPDVQYASDNAVGNAYFSYLKSAGTEEF